MGTCGTSEHGTGCCLFLAHLWAYCRPGGAMMRSARVESRRGLYELMVTGARFEIRNSPKKPRRIASLRVIPRSPRKLQYSTNCLT